MTDKAGPEKDKESKQETLLAPQLLTTDGIPTHANGHPLSETAIQALREARARRDIQGVSTPLAKEINGPKGQEPTRFGDWEKNGRVSDF